MEFSFILVGLLIVALTAFLLKKRGSGPRLGKPVPGPKPKPIVGNIDEAVAGVKPMFDRLHKNYGRVVGIKAGPLGICSIADPKLVEEVLRNPQGFTNSELFRDAWGAVFPEAVLVLEGEPWKHTRKLVQDGIHRQKLGSLMVEVNNITRKLMNKLKKNHSDGTPVDILTNINHVLFDAFGKFGYGVEFNTLDGQNKEVFEHGMVLWDGVSVWSTAPMNWFKYLPLPVNFRTWSSARWMGKFATKLVAERRAQLAKSQDASETASCLLDALIKARDDESGAKLTERQVIDNVVLLFFASFETTGNSLAFLCRFLSEHQDVQEKLYQEVSELADDFEEWTDQKQILTAVESLKYLDLCLKESARLIPVAPGIPRTSKVDIALGDYHIDKNTVLVLNGLVMGQDHTLWNTTPEDILTFRPERWESIDSMDVKSVYLPFGSGGRMCVGFRIATLEMKTIMATLLRSFRLKPDPSHTFEIGGDMTLRPKNGCWFLLEPRNRK